MCKITPFVLNYMLCVKKNLCVKNDTLCVKSHPECKIIYVKLHTFNFCNHDEDLNTSFLNYWKILHLTEFFTQPAVVMVVTNIRYEGYKAG